MTATGCKLLIFESNSIAPEGQGTLTESFLFVATQEDRGQPRDSGENASNIL
jgi:hypothetical protein